jgi:hypothetical protein
MENIVVNHQNLGVPYSQTNPYVTGGNLVSAVALQRKS